MANQTNGSQSPISPDLLEILRDPQAIQESPRHGADPGRLELVRGAWLVSADTGYKYPIRDGIPVMLIEEGARWKDTPVEALPVPPPAATPAPATRSDEAAIATPAAGPDPRLLIAAAVALMVLVLVLVGLTRRQAAPDSEQPPVA
jgi:uncharacterized protein YbaR (Trm112 family)